MMHHALVNFHAFVIIDLFAPTKKFWRKSIVTPKWLINN